jgi:chromosome segregation ATPase
MANRIKLKVAMSMTDKKPTSITFEQVQKAASEMISLGVKPTVRGIRSVTGGRNETVAEYLDNFNKKRDAEVSKLAGVIGSSEVGKLIAGEIQTVIDRKTEDLNVVVTRQAAQIEELIGILKDNEAECSERVDFAKQESDKAIHEANIKIDKYSEKVKVSEESMKAANDLLSLNQSETKNDIATMEQTSKLMVESAKAEAESLVNAANKQTSKAEAETTLLREQVKLLSINQAKHELEQEQFKQANLQLDSMRNAYSDNKTENVRFETQNSSLAKDVERLGNDLTEAKEQANQLPKAQAQLLEMQKQISQLQNNLSQTERERESLSRALAVNENNKK